VKTKGPATRSEERARRRVRGTSLLLATGGDREDRLAPWPGDRAHAGRHIRGSYNSRNSCSNTRGNARQRRTSGVARRSVSGTWGER
jgi:hypothetical protein